MSEKGKLKDAIKKLSALSGEQYCVVCTVDSVDLVENTCELTPVNGDADLQAVRLLSNNNKGFLIIPKVGSVVIASFLNDAVAYVSMFSEVDEIQLNGAGFLGIVKVTELVQKLNALEAIANQLIVAKNLIASAAVSSPGTPVTNATLAAFITGITVMPVTPTVVNNLQNTTVKHGNGT